MKKMLMAGAATVALTAGQVQADGHLPFTPGEGDFNWESYEALKSMDLSGETITVFGTWLGLEEERFENAMKYFEDATGAKVEYAGSDSFEQQIVIDLEAGSAPNLAIFPQPGLAKDLAARGLLAPLAEADAQWVRDNYAAGQSWVDLATYADDTGTEKFYGLFYRVDVKSLVWYSPENFEDAGYDVPTTMEEIVALSDQIVADGETPWCIGLGSGAATGWPATDWVEEMLLRTQPPAVYDEWVANTISFDDERIVAAIVEFGKFALNDDYVAGGAGAVASTDFRDSPAGLFASPPQCYMHRQASFIPAFFPEGTSMGEDVDFFYFPSFAGEDLGKPVLGAGTVMTITNDSKGARALMDYLKTPIAHEIWMAQGGFLTPHSGANTALYDNDAQRKMGDILLGADTFRFDGSDLMPGAIGAGVFWTGMVDYAGGKPAADVAKSIQDTWTSIK